MPIKVKIEKEFHLSDTWCSKEDFEKEFKGNREAFIELVMEDWISFIDEAGGISGIIKSFEWEG